MEMNDAIDSMTSTYAVIWRDLSAIPDYHHPSSSMILVKFVSEKTERIINKC